ncbi:hypothetical protein GLOIN_2v1480316 [Rhizophagus irregularis DAOM 181602=DAOM 197198]|uniref:Uncharacterized protein n=2 Tax=Rhizophagus irregularis TaxID=588596 RepID=A0A015KZA2_RHIIW|nr:hypothetical protein RirG_133870 [Rhizophagus irregularis DAOM 197198w]GET64027.1 hypothetical protein GLOIN_2v1480316 [Rhizophagus irregularis DAOM 181602=DAOM 197198]CAG8446792.1 1315_t:CDS:2 [Rhizophagus irregularis]
MPDVATPTRTRSSSSLLGGDKPLPASFTEMSNILYVCNWLVKRPHILELANQMLTANNTSSNTNMVVNSLHGNDNLLGMNKAHLRNEESKCLFLRIRNPSSSDLNNFILAVLGYKPCSEMAKVTFQEMCKRLGDFRNKFNSTLHGLVDELYNKLVIHLQTS